MNPLHRYPTRFQTKFQDKLQGMIQQGKELYEKRKEEVEEYGEHGEYILKFNQLFREYHSAVTRKDRIRTIQAVFLHIIVYYPYAKKSKTTASIIVGKILEFRLTIQAYRNENSAVQTIKEQIQLIKNDNANRHKLDNIIEEVQNDRAEINQMLNVLESSMNIIDRLMKE